MARKAVADGIKEGRRKVVLQADGAVPHGEVLKVAGAMSEVEERVRTWCRRG